MSDKTFHEVGVGKFNSRIEGTRYLFDMSDGQIGTRDASFTELEFWDEIERLRAAFDTLDKRHTSLLDDIERWNSTIAVGRDRADQMEDVIKAAQNLDRHRDEGYATLVSYLIRLHEALATYEATKMPMPTTFNRI